MSALRHFVKPSGQNTHQSVGRHGCLAFYALAFYAPIFRALILAPSRSRMSAIIAARSYHGEKFRSCLATFASSECGQVSAIDYRTGST
jgi:hypothetical protein